MPVRRAACLAAAIGLAVALAPGGAAARGGHWHGGVGVFIGPPAPYWGPRPYGYYGGYWGPAFPPPVVYAPPPVVYAPPPVVYAPAPVPGPTWIVPPADYAVPQSAPAGTGQKPGSTAPGRKR